ncbi:zinc finger SWIM domain-containing protein 3-like [Dysidea avara]|uniref:zinc finger SWIM domain-containing protein 3-like n=1 Tax=Dysidea avara TaxID=196820 RepID=UPI003333C70A
MNTMFDKFPELLLIDATYKLTELRTPLYVLLVVDGSGNSEIVAIYLTVQENEPSIQKLADVFKKYNASLRSTKVIMTDKDMTERNVFSREFPDAVMHLCLFYTLRTFKREFSRDKMNITAGQREHLLELLQEMTYAKSETA